MERLLSGPFADLIGFDTSTWESKPGGLIAGFLKAIRTHLEMDVAFVSEFAERRRYFRHVDQIGLDHPIELGGSDPLDESYCHRVVEGRLPALIHDAQDLEAAADLSATRLLPVGAHVSVPLIFSDGRVFGTFCCFSFRANHTLTSRDLEIAQTFAAITAHVLESELRAQDDAARRRDRIQSLIDGDGHAMVYQPICSLLDGEVVGFEGLSRFTPGPLRAPDVWFKEANAVGLGIELECKALAAALQGARRLPQEAYVSLNISPAHLLEIDLEAALGPGRLDRVVLELTEHALVEAYEEIGATVRPLRQRGLRLAVDDAGAGYANFKHILNLQPEFIKLDLSVTRDIDCDAGRRALTTALVAFAAETGAELIAEGVETAAELATLQRLGVLRAQGFFLSPPLDLEAALAFADPDRRSRDLQSAAS